MDLLVTKDKKAIMQLRFDEYTLCDFDGNGMEFIAVQLLQNYELNGGRSPILDEDLQSVGVSSIASKRVTNIIQVLYVSSDIKDAH